MGASQEMQEDYRQLFLDMAKLAKYSLGEVTEIEDGFEIQGRWSLLWDWTAWRQN